MAHVWTVPSEADGARLDRWLADQLPELSRSRVQTLIQQGHVKLDDRPAKPSVKLPGGARLTLELPPDPLREIDPEPMDLDVVHEDDHIVVVNKPSGWVVHPAPGHERGTLVNGLLHDRQLASSGDPSRPGVVHRLDKATSGVLVVAKTDRAYTSLLAQFKARTVRKTYLALVHGVLEETEGRIEAPIGRHRRHPQEQTVRSVGGKDALTDFEVLARFPDMDRTLLAVYPYTGRTHQIRVHLQAIEHPIVGDAVYGLEDDADALMLHAWGLELDHPDSGERMRFTAAPPPRFRTYVDGVAGRRSPSSGPERS